MHSPRPRSGLIILFLWICPLTGTSAFIGHVLRSGAPPPFYKLESSGFFDLPSGAWEALLAAALLVPLLLACATRRAISFVAGISLIILLASIAAWIRSHHSIDDLMFCRLENGSPIPTVHEQMLRSSAGGISFRSRRVIGERMGNIASLYLLALGRDRSLSFGTAHGGDGYPVNYPSYLETPHWLRHLGFAAGIRPQSDWNPQDGGTLFAIALPYWFVCLSATPLPLAWTLRHRRRRRDARRSNAGTCQNCGYDLRATPDAAGARLPICPECGAPNPPQAMAHPGVVRNTG